VLSGGAAIAVAAPGTAALAFGGDRGVGSRGRSGVFGLVGSLVVLPGLFVLVGLEQIGGVEKRALFVADVYEGGLNAGEDRFDPAQIDVSDHPPMVGAVNQQLDKPVVLEDRDPRFARATVDENLALHKAIP
jgi:hypothetical protein